MPWSPIRADLPSIAIIGRPNTGKSTLFNRLLKRRQALTYPTPGVTRDFIEAEFQLNQKIYNLIDTGGFSLAKDFFSSKIKEQIIDLSYKVDLILLVVEEDKLRGEDYAIIELLQAQREKIILVVNKVDDENKENLVYQAFELGFKQTIGISAEHNRNLPNLRKLIADYFNQRPSFQAENKKPESPYLKLAILGRPNTGKSTLLNSLLNVERALISDLPGTTRDVIEACFFWKDKKILIQDTAGIRRKQKVNQDLEYFSVNRAIGTIEKSDVILLLITAEEGFTDQDKRIAALIEKRGRGMVIGLNKCDLLKEQKQLKLLEEKIKFIYPPARHLPIVRISALKHYGFEKLRQAIFQVNAELDLRIETAELNKVLHEWKEKYSIPLKKKIKLHYLTQVSTRPVRFVLFASHLDGFPGSYLLYLKNRLRERFGFKHIPLSIELRRSK